MARFIPAVPDSFNNSLGEERAVTALRALPDDYLVFHSFSWIGVGTRTQGEADLVIIHPRGGILVIEVKSGEIEYKNGEWYQTNTLTRETNRMHPFRQAMRSRFEICDRLEACQKLTQLPAVGHGVWFPTVKIEGDLLPPEASKEITFDQRDLLDPKNAIDQALTFWQNKLRMKTDLDDSALAAILEVLAPRFRAVPGLKGQLADVEQQYIQLTKEQAVILDYLEEQKTAVIHGLAGTGKTVLARERAKLLADRGEQVLFLCYNSFLKDFLREQYFHPNITFHNLHSLALSLINKPLVDYDLLLADFENYLENIDPELWPYEHLVIDEGQDLGEHIVTKLRDLILGLGGSFYLFYDRNQLILKNEKPTWLEAAECRLVLQRNCRNTAEIFQTSCSLIRQDSATFINSVRGKKPTALFYSEQKALVEGVEEFVAQARAAGIPPEEIVILTALTEEKSALAGLTKIGGMPISLQPEKGSVLFTTIRKYKGLEAQAVMVVDISLARLEQAETRRLVYVGSSRAKHLLQLAFLADVPETEYGSLLKEIDPNRNLPKNKRGLARLLRVKTA